MKTLAELNITLNKMTSNKALIDTTRANIVNDIIVLVIDEAKGHSFTNKRVAQKWIIEELLSDDNKNLDNYAKRALKIARAILVDGYKIKKEALTIAQAEALIKCDKAVVNSLMVKEDEEYTEEAKIVIAESEEVKALKALKELKAVATMEQLLKTFGTDTKKVLNLMIRAI